jgi:hypothetical protein
VGPLVRGTSASPGEESTAPSPQAPTHKTWQADQQQRDPREVERSRIHISQPATSRYPDAQHNHAKGQADEKKPDAHPEADAPCQSGRPIAEEQTRQGKEQGRTE